MECYVFACQAPLSRPKPTLPERLVLVAVAVLRVVYENIHGIHREKPTRTGKLDLAFPREFAEYPRRKTWVASSAGTFILHQAVPFTGDVRLAGTVVCDHYPGPDVLPGELNELVAQLAWDTASGCSCNGGKYDLMRPGTRRLATVRAATGRDAFSDEERLADDRSGPIADFADLNAYTDFAKSA